MRDNLGCRKALSTGEQLPILEIDNLCVIIYDAARRGAQRERASARQSAHCVIIYDAARRGAPRGNVVAAGASGAG